ncbi:hypothetical protein [Streptomyces atratus]|uniref:hypothetical protein n=1 Tax=Streptomyces atratus TaxID=1893 RepID=UPI001300A735|nr:hypothetical protein [Streptomyces atratus]
MREANVSDEVVVGERPERALALLAPGDPARRELEAALARPMQGRSPLETFTRFDPDEVLALEDTRAQGSMTYEPACASGGMAASRASICSCHGPGAAIFHAS